MLLNNDENKTDLQPLQNESTSDTIGVPPQQLFFPLDHTSQAILRKSVEQFLPTEIFDLIWNNVFHYFTLFDSIDGFNTSGGTIVVGGTALTLTTGAVSTNSSELTKVPEYQVAITFAQPSNFRSAFSMNAVKDQTIYIVVGSLSGSYYGFKVIGGVSTSVLYGVSSDGTTETKVQLVSSISSSTVYGIEAKYTPNKNVIFNVSYLNASSINTSLIIGASVTTHLPRPLLTTPNLIVTSLLDIKITTSENVAKTINISMFEYLQSTR